MWTDFEKNPIYDLNVAPVTPQEESIAKNEPATITRFFSSGFLVLLAPFVIVYTVIVVFLMFVVAGISIPWMFVVQFFIDRREARFVVNMKKVGRLLSFEEAISKCVAGGYFIEEWFSMHGPYRLWWTSEAISELSPHLCCYEELPFGLKDYASFFDWTRARYTDPGSGTALLVQFKNCKESEVNDRLVELRAKKRCVSIGPLWP